MPDYDWLALMGMGGFFILLGLGAVIWGWSEEKSYFNSLSERPDKREFMEHWPRRPQFGSLKIGGRIALAIGILMVIIGGVLWLTG